MIKKLSTLLLASLLMVFAISPVTSAAKPDAAAKPTANSTEVYGIDVSYPQCGRSLPTDQAFGIVGVNGGNAASTNPCLAEQLRWASRSSGIVASQPKLQLYVNTGNPGQVQSQMSTKWPTANTAPITNPYGPCAGENNQACSWQYAWDRAAFAVDTFKAQAPAAGISADPAQHKWWLDVETMNSWQTGSAAAYKNNAAAIEGWAAYFQNLGAKTGLYSTAAQWSEIVGTAVGSTSNLNGLDNWRPGGASLATAKQACSAKPLTAGGKVVLTQYVVKNLDYNYSCV